MDLFIDIESGLSNGALQLFRPISCCMQATYEMDTTGTVTTRWRVDATQSLPAPLASPDLMKCASPVAIVLVLLDCL